MRILWAFFKALFGSSSIDAQPAKAKATPVPKDTVQIPGEIHYLSDFLFDTHVNSTMRTQAPFFTEKKQELYLAKFEKEAFKLPGEAKSMFITYAEVETDLSGLLRITYYSMTGTEVKQYLEDWHEWPKALANMTFEIRDDAPYFPLIYGESPALISGNTIYNTWRWQNKNAKEYFGE